MSNVKRIRANRYEANTTPAEEHISDPMKMDPDALRNELRDALLALKFDERAAAVTTIATGLKDGGINLRSVAVLLGLQGDTVADLTPSDLAHLVRYARINAPRALKAVTRPLTDLMARPNDHETHRPRKAA